MVTDVRGGDIKECGVASGEISNSSVSAWKASCIGGSDMAAGRGRPRGGGISYIHKHYGLCVCPGGRAAGSLPTGVRVDPDKPKVSVPGLVGSSIHLSCCSC